VRLPAQFRNINHVIREADLEGRSSIHEHTLRIIREKKINSHPVLRFIATRKLPDIEYPTRTRISTDGSKNPQKGTAYAVYTAGYDQFTCAGRVESIEDIGRAELFAIVHAIVIGAKFNETHIYTDSQYALSAYEQAISEECIKRKEQDYDLRILIREIHQLRGDRSTSVHKVMAHATDHEDLQERKRTLDIMKTQYGEEEAKKKKKLIEDNQRADSLAKWARDNPHSPRIQLTHTLSEKEKFSLSERNGSKIFSPRKYLRRRNRSERLADVQKLAHICHG
jgi:ribonuclease HI